MLEEETVQAKLTLELPGLGEDCGCTFKTVLILMFMISANSCAIDARNGEREACRDPKTHQRLEMEAGKAHEHILSRGVPIYMQAFALRAVQEPSEYTGMDSKTLILHVFSKILALRSREIGIDPNVKMTMEIVE